MNSKITLSVTQGTLEGAEYTFDAPARCTVGRSSDCDIHVPERWENMDVSRHHCEFEIDPPTVWVRDLSSHNGTFVNGQNIGLRRRPLIETDEVGDTGVAFALKDGDEVRVGHTVFHVTIPEAVDAEVQKVPIYFV